MDLTVLLGVLVAFPACTLGLGFRESDNGYDVGLSGRNGFPDSCPVPRVGLEWVLYQRQPDYGWGEHTHRAIVVLELGNYGHQEKDVTEFGHLSRNSTEIELMRHQLEVELTKFLIRNNTGALSFTDLALYVQALLAIGRDPRNFYGVDLVGHLLEHIRDEVEPHPIIVLVLCGAQAVEMEHLIKIRKYLHVNFQDKELSAIALKAFACAAGDERISRNVTVVSSEMQRAAATLASYQKPDGSFGNLYTTALIFQALKLYGWTEWNGNATAFLKEKEPENVNMLSVYFLQMAYHAEKSLFRSGRKPVDIQTEDGFPTVEALKSWPLSYYVQYTLKVGDIPEVYHTITMKIPSNATFFDVMRLAADQDSKFNFSYHLNSRKEPIVYRISGIPNDAEQGLYWRLVHESAVDHIRHSSILEEQKKAPSRIQPMKDTHYIYWYCDLYKKIDGNIPGSSSVTASVYA